MLEQIYDILTLGIGMKKENKVWFQIHVSFMNHRPSQSSLICEVYGLVEWPPAMLKTPNMVFHYI